MIKKAKKQNIPSATIKIMREITQKSVTVVEISNRVGCNTSYLSRSISLKYISEKHLDKLIDVVNAIAKEIKAKESARVKKSKLLA